MVFEWAVVPLIISNVFSKAVEKYQHVRFMWKIGSKCECNQLVIYERIAFL